MSQIHCQLWMGAVEPYMTESFIMNAFQQMGENPLSVKVMRNRITYETCGYCFVHFENDEEAINAMYKLNGKLIPNASPPTRFKLNTATPNGRISMVDRDFSLWIGDLSPEIDDYHLYKTFATRYESVRAAKVVLGSEGISKGYGFIRFANEEEQKHCLFNMNGFKGLGTKPIKISTAVPKGVRPSASTNVMSGGYNCTQDYSQQSEVLTYWQRYTSWTNPPNSSINLFSQAESSLAEDDLELIDHNSPIDIDAWNKELTDRDYNMWDALESSKWLPLEI